MKNEKDKILFVIVLASFLGVLLIYSNKISSIKELEDDNNNTTEEHKLELENDTLYLQQPEFGTIIILGEGSLNESDLSSLLTNNKINISDVENIIIGDDITELGYNVIKGYDYLQTLKIGSSVTKIRNGAVRDCINLKFVYLPKDVEKIAVDFLANSGKCIIVSNGDLQQILKDSHNLNILYNIESFEEMNKALEEGTLYDSFTFDKLATNDPDTGEYHSVLHNGFLQFGPNISMNSGEYSVNYSGKGFDTLSANSLYLNTNGLTENFEIYDIDISNEMIKYNVFFDEDMNGVEFCLINDSYNGNDIEIFELEIYEKIIVPDICRRWWD